MDEPDFRAGDLSIAYVEEHPDLLCTALGEQELVAAALAGALLEEEHRERHRAPRIASSQAGMSAWRASARPWRGDE
jgi:acetyl-CoA carboxylase biotin carboxylase subunit